jgi:hypothetical protein
VLWCRSPGDHGGAKLGHAGQSPRHVGIGRNTALARSKSPGP